MPRTAVSAAVGIGTPYTVPAGKVLICKASWQASPIAVLIDGVQAAYLSSGDAHFGPLVANAGQVLSASSGTYSFNGFLYDV